MATTSPSSQTQAYPADSGVASTPADWITAEEYCAEWQRLRERRLPLDSPEVTALLERLRRRNDVLFERFGRDHVRAHPGRWIGISTEGATLIRDTAAAARSDAEVRFGTGNFAVRKLTHDLQLRELRH